MATPLYKLIVASGAVTQYDCTFEQGLCGWQIDSSYYKFQWGRTNNGIPSRGTGPSTDAQLSRIGRQSPSPFYALVHGWWNDTCASIRNIWDLGLALFKGEVWDFFCWSGSSYGFKMFYGLYAVDRVTGVLKTKFENVLGEMSIIMLVYDWAMY